MENEYSKSKHLNLTLENLSHSITEISNIFNDQMNKIDESFKQ